MKRKYLIGLLGLAAVVLVVGGAWLYAAPASSSHIGPNSVDPAYIVVKTPTRVTFTSHLPDNIKKNHVVLVRTDASGTPVDFVGTLNDKGKGADASKKDEIYTLQVVLNEPVVGPIQFRVAARFPPEKGKKDDPDDDWDTDLAALNSIKDATARRNQCSKLLKKLQNYTLSDPIQLAVNPVSISWSPSSLDLTLSTGEKITRTLTITSDGLVENARLDADSSIIPFVTILPNSFSTLRPNQPQTITISIVVPPGALPGTYNGGVGLKLSNQTLPNSLTILVNVWLKYLNSKAPVSFAYPQFPDLSTRVDLDSNGSIAFDILNGATYAPAFYVSINNTFALTPAEWFKRNVDPSVELLVSTYTQNTYSDGRTVLLLTGGVPTEWEGGSLAQAYIFSPNGSQVAIVQISQDDPLEYHGMSSTQATEVIDRILGTIQFR